MLFLQKLTTATLIDAQEYSYSHFNKRVYGRDYNALSFRISSDATIGFSGKSISAGDKSVTFFPKELEYTRKCTHDRMLVLHFDCDTFLSREIECVYPKNESIQQLFEQIVMIWTKKEQGCRFHATALLYQLFYLLEKEFGRQSHYPAILESALEIMSHEYCDALLTIGGIAKRLNVSEVYLRQLFLKNIGKSPKQYVTDLRIEKAKTMLKQSDLSVESVAVSCGFSEPKNFAVAFKSKTATSPTDYRKKYSSYI